VLKHLHPSTHEAAIEVASNLIPDDYRELVEGHGMDPLIHIPLGIIEGDHVYFKTPSGKAAAIGGVSKDGRLWMVSTPAIYECPKLFLRETKRWVDTRPNKLLWNIVDKRNIKHLRYLKYLGCKFLKEIIYGPNQLPFIEFCKIQRTH
tara:strand:- start:957 stop:1400 length:444 start_codon:yes stop_codon:yes gene_type:complete